MGQSPSENSVMTPEQARILILEDALEQAQNVVSFMHGCLTDPGYSYEYPEQTSRHLERWGQLVPVRRYCVHSVHKRDCPSCQEHLIKMGLLAEAERVLQGANHV